MDEFYENYKSTWRPLIRENEISAAGMPSGAVKLKKDAENAGKHANDGEAAKQNDILNKLSEISADIHEEVAKLFSPTVADRKSVV